MGRKTLETCRCGAELLAPFPKSESYGIVRDRPGHPLGNVVFHVGQRQYVRRRWAEHRAACALRAAVDDLRVDERTPAPEADNVVDGAALFVTGPDFWVVGRAAFSARFLGYRDVYARLVDGVLHTAPSATELNALAGAGPAND
jgi:hypothetical protein